MTCNPAHNSAQLRNLINVNVLQVNNYLIKCLIHYCIFFCNSQVNQTFWNDNYDNNDSRWYYRPRFLVLITLWQFQAIRANRAFSPDRNTLWRVLIPSVGNNKATLDCLFSAWHDVDIVALLPVFYFMVQFLSNHISACSLRCQVPWNLPLASRIISIGGLCLAELKVWVCAHENQEDLTKPRAPLHTTMNPLWLRSNLLSWNAWPTTALFNKKYCVDQNQWALTIFDYQKSCFVKSRLNMKRNFSGQHI